MPFLIGVIAEVNNKVLRTDSQTFCETQNVFEGMLEPSCIVFTVQNVDLRLSNQQNARSSEVTPAINEDQVAHWC